MDELENKIKVLESRISRLEKIESKRKTFKIIKVCMKIVILLAILFGLWMGYNYVNETIIKPYKETVDEIKDTYNDIKDNNLVDKAKNILGKKE